ncbi:hypothetical protein [Nostoc sp. NMS1]|uniref:hypothetical protein n=1 Tax=Nostoc sp. NMS1 TaxID=2815388 RepID=UPI0025E13901|nr:hypothetical protein [Nostoc sp. NMS1]
MPNTSTYLGFARHKSLSTSAQCPILRLTSASLGTSRSVQVPNAQYFDLPRLRSAQVAQYKCPMPNTSTSLSTSAQ